MSSVLSCFGFRTFCSSPPTFFLYVIFGVIQLSAVIKFVRIISAETVTH